MRTGCGAEIVKIIDAVPYEAFIRTEDVARQLAARISMPYDKARAAVNVKLKRSADQGKIRRLQKGVYCHVKDTVFGAVTPDIDQMVIRQMTVRDGLRIGYGTGAVLLHRLGLSTLLPRVLEVATNCYHASLPEGCRVRLIKPVTTITEANWRYLRFIDALVYMQTAHIDADAPAMLMAEAARKQALDPLTLLFTARRHYPAKTVLLLTDLLMEAEDKGPETESQDAPTMQQMC